MTIAPNKRSAGVKTDGLMLPQLRHLYSTLDPSSKVTLQIETGFGSSPWRPPADAELNPARWCVFARKAVPMASAENES